MERFNFSDQIVCGEGTLYLQTHTTEEPWSAESLLYETGRVIAKKCIDLSHVHEARHLQRSAETFHMENYYELEEACGAMAAAIHPEAAVLTLHAVHVLLGWNLFTRALHMLVSRETSLGGNIDYWLAKAESLLALKRYTPALQALKKAGDLDKNNGAVLLLLATGLLAAAVEQRSMLPGDDYARLIEQTGTCLSRVAVFADEYGEAARQAVDLMERTTYDEALNILRLSISTYRKSL